MLPLDREINKDEGAILSYVSNVKLDFLVWARE